VAVPSNPYVSAIAGWILTYINIYLLKNPIGYASGADGDYMIGGDRFAPDVAYISKARQPQLTRKGYNINPPELAVEVISDESSKDEQAQMATKIGKYLAVGTVVWAVYPESQCIKVYSPTSGPQSPETYSIGATITTDLLPGFGLPVRDVFASIE
jgi:Uma2 family endonuclease